MKKLKFAVFIFVASFAASCGDEGPLKECIVCTYPGSSPEPEHCATKVAAETWRAGMESSGYSCYKK